MNDKSVHKEEVRQPCPYNSVNWLSKTSFWWLNSLFRTGYKRQLTQDNLFDVLPEDESSSLSDRVQRTWDEELGKKKKKPNLFRAVLLAFKWECLIPGIFLVISEVLRACQPYLLGNLVGYFDPEVNIPIGEAYAYAVSLGICGVLQLIFMPIYYFRMHKVAMQMRAAVSGVIFRKVLKMSSMSLHNTTSGQVVNLMSTDVEKFNLATETFHNIWIAPVNICVIIYLMHRYIGTAALFTLIIIFCIVPLQFIIARYVGRLRMLIGACSDKRIGMMNEILVGMRIIKMYCWEKPFSDLIAQLRKSEIKYRGYTAMARSMNVAIYLCCSRLMKLVVFIGAWKLQTQLSSEIVFTIIGWLEMLRLSVFLFWFTAIEQITQLTSSLNRIQTFLLLNDVDSSYTEHETCNPSSKCAPDVSVQCENMSACWEMNRNSSRNEDGIHKTNCVVKKDTTVTPFGLKNISLQINKGELIAVIGSVGAGKSSLLLTFLGELKPQDGRISTSGMLGYVSQEPWVFSGTVKQNILFGENYDPDMYEDIVNVCALKKDIDSMPYGSDTLVGERGLHLSGGQKARLTLARCLYRKADIYLLDDPLSAVDVGVGRHIFQECICKHLQDSTRILVTHQLQYLPNVDRIVIINQGKVTDIGSYDELIAKGTEFSSFMPQSKKLKNRKAKDTENVGKDGKCENGTAEIIKNEDMSKGSVGFHVYRQYLNSSYAAISVPTVVLFALLSVISMAFSDWFLAEWSQSRDESQLNISRNDENTTLYLNVSRQCLPCTTSTSNYENVGNYDQSYIIQLYIIMSCSYFGSTIVMTMLFSLFCVIAGHRLHNKMFHIVLQAKSRFFDTNPVGRVLNRFARDMGFIDSILPGKFFIAFMFVPRMLAMVAVTCVVNPWLLLLLVPLAVAVVLLRHYAVQTTRDIKRLEAVARSPVYSHLSNTLQGLQTIRSQGMEKTFIQDFDNFQNCHTTAWFHFLACYRWFSFRSLCVVVIYLNFTTILSLILRDSLNMESGMIGLAVNYCILLADPFEYWVRMTAEMENAMTSVERVVSYTNLEQEADKTSQNPPPDSWPQLGGIKMKDLCLRYFEEGLPVLKHITCTINSNQKIGIVGRTGSGKSSLLTSLLRIYEPTGSIVIDGIDVLKIGLHELRRKISVIPQDSVLFNGSLRKNLDPFEEFADQELWNVLEQVQLKEKVDGLDGKLYSEMSESGSNFSVGQRQLVCLARAILHYNKILVLDEATANVDDMTDKLIQRTIRESFKDCTVLTVAHRLHTIMDSDKVMVFEDGELKEFDSPYNLLQSEQGIFYDMVQQTGEEQAKQLLNTAENYYKGQEL